MKDPYDILGVDRSDDPETIKRAYRRLAFRYHPDRNDGDPEAARRFRKVCEAYERIRPGGGGPTDRADDVAWPDLGFEALARAFEAFNRGWRRDGTPPSERPRDGQHRRTRVAISFEESVSGTEVETEYEIRRPCEACGGDGAPETAEWRSCPVCEGRGERRSGLFGFGERMECQNCRGRGREAKPWCSTCRGSGLVTARITRTISVPAGIDDGETIRVPDAGDPGLRGGESGDLKVTIEVTETEQYRRRGRDIITEVEVPFSTAVLGGEIGFDTPNGSVIMDVPAGTSDGQRFRLRDRGFPVPDGSGEEQRRGHLIAIARIQDGKKGRDGSVSVRAEESFGDRVVSRVRRVVERTSSSD